VIQFYLGGRYQKVLTDKINAYDSVSSGWKTVTNGVPQGSNLSPLLFLVYMNNLPNMTNHDAKVACLQVVLAL
jgi:hypothetical protein